MSQSQIDILESVIEDFRNAIEEHKRQNLPQKDIDAFENQLSELENLLESMKLE